MMKILLQILSADRTHEFANKNSKLGGNFETTPKLGPNLAYWTNLASVKIKNFVNSFLTFLGFLVLIF